MISLCEVSQKDVSTCSRLYPQHTSTIPGSTAGKPGRCGRFIRNRQDDMRSPRARSSSPLSCLAAALMPHSRGSRSRNKPCSELRRPGRPRSWVCPGSFTQSATPIKVSCPSRSEVVQFQRGFIEHTKIRPGQISSLSSPSPHLSPPPYHSPFSPLPHTASQPCTPVCARDPSPPCVSSACVCMCMCVSVCVCQTAPATTGPGVSGWMFPLSRISSPSVNPSAQS